jgi:hypothetical protein
MTWTDAMEICLKKEELFVDQEKGFVFLGFRPPSHYSPEEKREHCMEHSDVVPWCHVSLANLDDERVAASLVQTLSRKLKKLLGDYEDVYLYVSPRGMHASSAGADLSTRCSVDYARCLEGLRALTEVLRSVILVEAAAASARVSNIGRFPHVSVLPLICLHWKSIRIGHLNIHGEIESGDYQLDFARDESFIGLGEHQHALKTMWKKYILRDCVLKPKKLRPTRRAA